MRLVTGSVIAPGVQLLALLALGLGAALVRAPAAPAAPEAPFGDRVSPALLNYNRASPFVGTAGVPGPGGIAEARALGFRLIVDLRTPPEGTGLEAAEADRVGIRYLNLPVAGGAPSDALVARFAQVVEDPRNWPVLVHCVSANRAGAMWALYRASRGVPPRVAIEEGRTAGLRPDREQRVRARLGLPPLDD